jgi:cold shock CspA family protein
MLVNISMTGWGSLPNPQIPKANLSMTQQRGNTACWCLKENTMKKMGTVVWVHPAATYCFIETPGENKRFAHINDFFQPAKMKDGQQVTYTPNDVPNPKRKYLAAVNVEAA